MRRGAGKDDPTQQRQAQGNGVVFPQSVASWEPTSAMRTEVTAGAARSLRPWWLCRKMEEMVLVNARRSLNLFSDPNDVRNGTGILQRGVISRTTILTRNDTGWGTDPHQGGEGRGGSNASKEGDDESKTHGSWFLISRNLGEGRFSQLKSCFYAWPG